MAFTRQNVWELGGDWADPILKTPYQLKDGLLHIPDIPGIGLEWNEEAVKAHLV